MLPEHLRRLPQRLLPQLDPAVLRAKLTRRSQWVALRGAQTPVREWETDWSQLDQRRVNDLRLYCPNGKVAVLGNTAGNLQGRLFQFKLAVAVAGQGRGTQAHVIGRVDTPNGDCTCWAWEYAGGPDGRGRLVGPFRDTWPALRYGGAATAHMHADAVGVR